MQNRPANKVRNVGRWRRSFTSIELLVVVAILAILAAHLLPGFGGARQAASGIACLANQRQVFAAAMLYTEEFDGILPKACVEYGVSGETKQWFDATKVGQYFDAKGESAGGGRPAGVLSCPAARYVTTTSNYGAVADIWGSDWCFGVRYLRRFESPAAKICVYDSKPWYSWGPWATVSTASYVYYQPPPHPYSAGSADMRHRNGHNAVFLDGHARWYPADPDNLIQFTGWRYRAGTPTENLLTAYAFAGSR